MRTARNQKKIQARAGLLALALAVLTLSALVATALAGKSASSVLGGEQGVTGGLFMNFGAPADVAVNQSSGQIYVADTNNNRIQRFDSAGNFERAWGRGVVAPGGSGDNGGVNEEQTVTVNASGGSFKLRFSPWQSEPPEQTPSIAFNAPAASVQAALETLSYIEPGDVSVSGPAAGPWAVEFSGQYAATDVEQMSSNASDLTGVPFSEVQTATIAGAPAFEICTVAVECRRGSPGDDPGGELNGDTQLALNQANGHLYASDLNNRVTEFDADGNFIRLWGAGVVAPGGAGDVPANETQRITAAPGDEPTSGFFVLLFDNQSTGATAFFGGNIPVATGNLSSGSNTVTGLLVAKGTATLSAGSPTLSALATTVGNFTAGQPISGAGIPPGTTILARINSTTFTLSANATASGTKVAVSSEGPQPFAPGQAITASKGIAPGTTITAVSPGALTLSANATQTLAATELKSGIPFNASAAEVQTQLEFLPNVAPGDVLLGGGPGVPWSVEFAGAYANTDVGTLGINPGNTSSPSGGSSAMFVETKRAAGGFEVCSVAAQCLAGSPGGDAAGQIGRQGSGPPAAIAVGPTGDVFLADPQNSRVSQHQADGDFVRSWGWGVDTEAPAFEICTAASSCNRGLRFKTLATPSTANTENGHFITGTSFGVPTRSFPTQIAVDGAGIVYASNADSLSGSSFVGPRLERFDSSKASAAELLLASPIRSVSPPNGAPAGPLPNNLPAGLEVDPGNDNLYYLGGGAVHEIDTSPLAAVDVHLAGSGASLAGLGYDDAGDRLFAPVTDDSRVLVADDPPPAPPAASLEDPQVTGPTSATFSGEITPGGPDNIETSYRFEYKKASDATWIKLPSQDVFIGDGNDPVAVQQSVSDLQVAVEYEVRLIATKEFGAGQTIAGPKAFTLDDLFPAVATAYPQPRTDTTARIAGTIDPKNKATTYYFEWGTDQTYGTKVPIPGGSLAAADGAIRVTETLTGLVPETTYHYRLVASNGVEEDPGDSLIEGEDVSFTTRASAPDPPERGYEMVTPPFKSVRSAVGFGARVRNNPNPGVPSLSGDTVAWQIPFFPLTEDVGYPANNDRRIIRRSAAGWVNETYNTLGLTPESFATLGQHTPMGSSGDMEAIASKLWSGVVSPESGALLQTEGDTSNRLYTFRKGSGTEGHTPWLSNPDKQVVALGGDPAGYAEDFDSDLARFNDDGSAMVRWGMYGGLVEDYGTLADEDPSDNGPLQGTMIYSQRAADPLAMPSAPKDLVNECTGAGVSATQIPARVGSGAPSDTIGAQACEEGSLVSLRGASVGGGYFGKPANGSQARMLGPSATALSNDGNRVFFQSPQAGVGPLSCEAATGAATSCPPQLYVRQYAPGGEPIVRWISRSRSVAGAENSYSGSPIAGQQIALMGAGTAFQGASREGRYVYFKTNAPLTPDDPNGGSSITTGTASDASWDLYRYELPAGLGADPDGGSLIRVSGGPNGSADPNTNPHTAGDGNGGVARFISDDGERAYFLTGAPIAGADASPPLGGATTPGTASAAESGTSRNLYLFDGSKSGAERYRFIARIPFSANAGAAVPAGRDACASFGTSLGFQLDSDKDDISLRPVNCLRGTPSGSHVAFTTSGQLSGEDADDAADVYLYDAEADELVRVSAPPPGAEPYVCNGDDVFSAPGPGEGCNADMGFPPSQGLSGPAYGTSDTGRGWGGMRYYNLATNPDGTVSLFFESRSELVPEDTNGDYWDVYEWRQGKLSLISPGNSDNDSWYSGNSVDGRDVFIWTSARIDPRELDPSDFDLYDARVGGGFPYTPPPTPCDVLAFKCEQEATSGPQPTAPATLATGASENVAGQPSRPRCAKGKTRRGKRCVARPRCAKGKTRRGKRCVVKPKKQKAKKQRANHEKRGGRR